MKIVRTKDDSNILKCYVAEKTNTNSKRVGNLIYPIFDIDLQKHALRIEAKIEYSKIYSIFKSRKDLQIQFDQKAQKGYVFSPFIPEKSGYVYECAINDSAIQSIKNWEYYTTSALKIMNIHFVYDTDIFNANNFVFYKI